MIPVKLKYFTISSPYLTCVKHKLTSISATFLIFGFNDFLQSRILTESDSLEEYVEWIYIPSEYGGQSAHDQLEWVQFYKVINDLENIFFIFSPLSPVCFHPNL